MKSSLDIVAVALMTVRGTSRSYCLVYSSCLIDNSQVSRNCETQVAIATTLTVLQEWQGRLGNGGDSTTGDRPNSASISNLGLVSQYLSYFSTALMKHHDDHPSVEVWHQGSRVHISNPMQEAEDVKRNSSGFKPQSPLLSQ